MKSVTFLLNNNSVFDDISSVLLSNSIVTSILNETYDIIAVYFLKLKVGTGTEKFGISENWDYSDLKKELLTKYGIKNDSNYFDSDLKKKDKTEIKEKRRKRRKRYNK